MKTVNIIFWILAVLIGLQCALFIFRGVSAMGSAAGVIRWMWIFKILTYFAITGMGFLIFKIKSTFKNKGFFDKENVQQLRSFGFIGLVATLFNSLANACMNTWAFFQRPVSFEEAQEKFYFYFSENIFDHSLVVYVLVLSVILLAYFAQNAIVVKGENEAFI